MNDPKWINASSGSPAYNARELRRLESVLLTQAGSPDRFGARQGVHPAGAPAVSLSGTTVTVQHTKAVVYPGLTTLSGPYVVQLEQTTHEVPAADGSNDRKDIVVLRVYDDDEDASGMRKAVSEYIAGDPAATPVEKDVPQGAFRMATVDVPADGTGSPTLTYNAPFTVAHGGIVPVRDDSELPGTDGGMYDGLHRWNQATNELQVHNGASTWETLASPLGFTQSLSGGVVLDEINGGSGTNTTEFTNIDQSYDWLMILWRGDHGGTPGDFSQLALRFNGDGGSTSYRRNRFMALDGATFPATTGDFSTAHAGVVGSHIGNTGMVLLPAYSLSAFTKTGMAMNMIYGYDTSGEMGWQASSFKWMSSTNAITSIRIWPGSQTWDGDLNAILYGFRGGY